MVLQYNKYLDFSMFKNNMSSLQYGIPMTTDQRPFFRKQVFSSLSTFVVWLVTRVRQAASIMLAFLEYLLG